MTNDEIENWKYRAYQRSGGRGKNLEFLFSPAPEKIDLHLHSDYSDGKKLPPEIGDSAEERGVKVLAITDHDTIKGPIEIASGKTNLGKFTGKFINGVEITARLGSSHVEVLVYDFGLDKAQELINSFEFPFLNRQFKIKRNAFILEQRLQKINEFNLAGKQLSLNDFIGLEIPNLNDPNKPDIELFSKIGLDARRDLNFDNDDFLQEIEFQGQTYKVNFDSFNSRLFGYIKNNPSGLEFVSSFKNEKGEPITTFADFNRCLLQTDDNMFSVDDAEYWPTVEEICEFARNTGGIALLAHPFCYEKKQGSPEDLITRAVEAGVDGIEMWHGFYTAEQIQIIYNICKENGFLFSMGSDGHGYPRTRGGRDFSIGIAPGYEGTDAKPDFVYETQLTTKTLHEIGMGMHRNEISPKLANQLSGKGE